MNLTKWKEEVIKVQDQDQLGDPYITPNGELCFEWDGYTYGCMGPGEEPYIIPPSTAWVGIDQKKMRKYEEPIDWKRNVPEKGIILAKKLK